LKNQNNIHRNEIPAANRKVEKMYFQDYLS
jgi:hypothetical protein